MALNKLYPENHRTFSYLNISPPLARAERHATPTGPRAARQLWLAARNANPVRPARPTKAGDAESRICNTPPSRTRLHGVAMSLQSLATRDSTPASKRRREALTFVHAYFGGRPRFATTRPRASAAQRSKLANLSASLRSGPGGITRASSKASTARVSQSYLPVERCVSLLPTARLSRSRDPFRILTGKTPILASLFPQADIQFIIPQPWLEIDQFIAVRWAEAD